MDRPRGADPVAAPGGHQPPPLDLSALHHSFFRPDPNHGLTSPGAAGTMGPQCVQVSVSTDEKGIRLHAGTGPPLYPGTNSAGSPLFRQGTGRRGRRTIRKSEDLPEQYDPDLYGYKGGRQTPAVNKGHPGSSVLVRDFFVSGPKTVACRRTRHRRPE